MSDLDQTRAKRRLTWTVGRAASGRALEPPRATRNHWQPESIPWPWQISEKPLPPPKNLDWAPTKKKGKRKKKNIGKKHQIEPAPFRANFSRKKSESATPLMTLTTDLGLPVSIRVSMFEYVRLVTGTSSKKITRRTQKNHDNSSHSKK